jgi:hypothetical protein
MSEHDDSVRPLTRRSFLARSGAAGVALLGGTLWRTAPAAARARRVSKVDTPIEHLVIACQENRSFDHDFAYAPAVQAKGYGPKAGYFEPDSNGGRHVPFEFTSPTTPDPPHGWTSVHQQYDGGRVDGFWQASQDAIGSGDAAIGYYTAAELPLYYSLLDDSALCANYFCSLLGRRGRIASTSRPVPRADHVGRLQHELGLGPVRHQRDEHPPADVSVGMGLQEECVGALRDGPLWRARRTCSPTTSMAASSTMCRRRSSTTTA